MEERERARLSVILFRGAWSGKDEGGPALRSEWEPTFVSSLPCPRSLLFGACGNALILCSNFIFKENGNLSQLYKSVQLCVLKNLLSKFQCTTVKKQLNCPFVSLPSDGY